MLIAAMHGYIQMLLVEYASLGPASTGIVAHMAMTIRNSLFMFLGQVMGFSVLSTNLLYFYENIKMVTGELTDTHATNSSRSASIGSR